MKRTLCAFVIISAVALLAAAVWFGARIPFAQQWPLFEALRTTAAIIFAVVGAWLAIVYPERLKISMGRGSGGASEITESFSSLFTPVANSTVILGLVLLVGLVAPIARQIDFVTNNVEIFRTLSFTFLVLLTLWQVWTVVLTLVPADMIKTSADDDLSMQETMEAAKGLGKTVKPSHGDK